MLVMCVAPACSRNAPSCRGLCTRLGGTTTMHAPAAAPLAFRYRSAALLSPGVLLVCVTPKALGVFCFRLERC